MQISINSTQGNQLQRIHKKRNTGIEWRVEIQLVKHTPAKSNILS
jgi:hypothetical protein